MVMYRRNRVPGGTYFFTITLRDRSSSILVDRVDDLRKVLLSVMRERPFQIDAMVVLPEHLHALWTLPPGDDDYPGRVRLLKSRFTRCVAAAGASTRRNAKGDMTCGNGAIGNTPFVTIGILKGTSIIYTGTR